MPLRSINHSKSDQPDHKHWLLKYAIISIQAKPYWLVSWDKANSNKTETNNLTTYRCNTLVKMTTWICLSLPSDQCELIQTIDRLTYWLTIFRIIPIDYPVPSSNCLRHRTVVIEILRYAFLIDRFSDRLSQIEVFTWRKFPKKFFETNWQLRKKPEENCRFTSCR